MKRWLLLSLLALIGLGSSAPQDPELDPKVAEAVETAVAERVALYWKECRIAVREEASEIVDSLLLIEATRTSADELPTPDRPDRPPIEAPVLEPDTVPLAPVLPPGRRDSLRRIREKELSSQRQ